MLQTFYSGNGGILWEMPWSSRRNLRKRELWIPALYRFRTIWFREYRQTKLSPYHGSYREKELDVVMCYGLNNITINEELLIKFYKYVRSQGMEFLTADHGRDAMKYIDIYIEKNNL